MYSKGKRFVIPLSHSYFGNKVPEISTFIPQNSATQNNDPGYIVNIFSLLSITITVKRYTIIFRKIMTTNVSNHDHEYIVDIFS